MRNEKSAICNLLIEPQYMKRFSWGRTIDLQMVPIPFATVVVCTRNRSTLLRQACVSILAIDPPKGGWELLIVAHCSTADPLAVAESVRRLEPDVVRVVEHPTIGLSSARNRGIAESRGDIVAFVDDDAYPATQWLTGLAAALSEPDVLCAGGPVDPIFEGDLPGWFLGRYLPYLTVWDPGPEPLDLRYNEYPRGANMAFRRDAFAAFGDFNTQLGRTADSLLSCEETELCLRFERGGYRTVYVPAARVRHTTPVDRLEPAWMERRFEAQGRSEAIVHWIHGGGRALLLGMAAHRRRADEAARDLGEGGDLHLRCQRRAARGYLKGMLTAPLTIPRYTPPGSDVVLAPWPAPGGC